MTTALDAYLKSQGISEAEFGELINRDRSMVNKLRRGVLLPTLILASEIEAKTNGEVPMQAWSTPTPSDLRMAS